MVIFVYFFSQETKTSEERIEHDNNDQDTNVEDNHIENNSDKENETREIPDAALSANRIQNDTEPAVKKTPPVSGLLGKLINISKAQKTPAADTEKNKADLSTFQRRIGSLVRLQTVNISEDDKNNENTADAADKAETKDMTRTKVKKQIRPRSLDGTTDENQSTIISRQRLSSSSDNERKDRIRTNMNPMQVSETGKLSEIVLKGSKAGMTLPVSGPIGSITVEKLRSESSSQSDSGILILKIFIFKKHFRRWLKSVRTSVRLG